MEHWDGPRDHSPFEEEEFLRSLIRSRLCGSTAGQGCRKTAQWGQETQFCLDSPSLPLRDSVSLSVVRAADPALFLPSRGTAGLSIQQVIVVGGRMGERRVEVGRDATRLKEAQKTHRPDAS